MKYKKSEQYNKVALILGQISGKYYNLNDFYPRENIDTIITSAGFLKYNSPLLMIEGTMTYWNQSNGAQLIGLETFSDSGESNLNFELYRNGQYVELQTSSILNQVNTLLKDENQKRFILPSKGKDIILEFENKSYTFIWKDGVFSLSSSY